MKYELKKFTKIIDEMMTFCMRGYDARHVVVEVERDDTGYHARFRMRDLDVSPDALEKLRKKLTIRRKPELEDYYWQLTGEMESSSELELVAMMCDESSVDYRDRTLTIRISRRSR